MPFLQKCLSVVLLLLTISSPVLAKTQATASISSNQVFLGDTFILTVVVNDTGSEYQLDTSKLVEDFTVFRPSRSQESTYINGDYTATTTWSLRLQAKNTGEFTIPALKLDSVMTAPITIQVSQPGKQQQSTLGEPIFIENKLDKSTVYLEQPMVLETKLFISENISNAEIQEPKLEGATIERIDTDNNQRQVIRNGVRYQLITYQYQITPSTSGDFTITSPLLTGSVRKAVRINEWKNRITNDPINVRGNNVEVTIKALPSNYEGDWLVSEDVRLIENNDLQQQEYTVGDPITRSISLQIASITTEKMPAIKLNYPSSLRYYPDQDDLKQGMAEGLLYSQRTITHAIIASESGQLTLPEIKIPWWNSKTEQQEFAILPAQTLTIKAAPVDNNNGNNNQQYANTQPLQSHHQQANNGRGNSSANADGNRQDNSTELLIWKISTLVLLLLLIMSIFYHLQQKKLNSAAVSNKDEKTLNTPPYQQLLVALQQGKTATVYVSLLRYFQSQQPTIIQLKEIEAVTGLNEENKLQLLDNLAQLELACSGMTHQWDAKTLIALIKLHHKVTKANKSNSISNINP